MFKKTIRLWMSAIWNKHKSSTLPVYDLEIWYEFTNSEEQFQYEILYNSKNNQNSKSYYQASQSIVKPKELCNSHLRRLFNRFVVFCTLCPEAVHVKLRFSSVHSGGSNENMISSLSIDPVTTVDVQIALERTKPSTAKLKPKYEAWQKEFESV